MPTNNIRFATPYTPETSIGAAIANIGNALFGGPSAAAVEAARLKGEETLVDLQTKKRKLKSQEEVAGLFEEANRYRPYMPGSKGNFPPPVTAHDRSAAEALTAAAADFFKTYPGALAAAASRGGYDIGQAAAGRVLATSSPMYTDAERAMAAVGKGDKLRPFDAFSEPGQFAAEKREEGAKTRTATAAAAAANPDKYQIRDLRAGILKGQSPDSTDARRIAGFDPPRTGQMQEDDEMSRRLGITPTEVAQYRAAAKVAENYKSPFGGVDFNAMRKDHPGLTDTYQRITTIIARAVNSPRIYGQRPSPDGRTWTVPSPINGQPVQAYREADGAWYIRDIDGKVKRIDRSDY